MFAKRWKICVLVLQVHGNSRYCSRLFLFPFADTDVCMFHISKMEHQNQKLCLHFLAWSGKDNSQLANSRDRVILLSGNLWLLIKFTWQGFAAPDNFGNFSSKFYWNVGSSWRSKDRMGSHLYQLSKVLSQNHIGSCIFIHGSFLLVYSHDLGAFNHSSSFSLWVNNEGPMRFEIISRIGRQQ